VFTNRIEVIVPLGLTFKLKNLHLEVNRVGLLVLLNLAEQLALTEEEWEQFFDFRLPILNQVIE